eukprot:5179585-Amphidinium_carterae.1
MVTQPDVAWAFDGTYCMCAQSKMTHNASDSKKQAVIRINSRKKASSSESAVRILTDKSLDQNHLQERSI